MRVYVIWTIAALAMACSSDSPTGVSDPPEPSGHVDLAIQSIVPAAGVRGTTLDVHVLGRGFDDGSEIHFERDGAPTDEIETNSTRFVDSQNLVANITIDAAARTGSYSIVVVTTGDKRGIGLEFFLAVNVVGTLLGGVSSIANDVNENGEVVGFGQIGFPGEEGFEGHHALYWLEGVLEDVGSGMASAINGGCAVGNCRVVGQRDGRPVVWQKQGGVWTSFELPTETGVGSASAINDRGDQIAGRMSLGGGLWTVVVWTESGGVWTATELPPASGDANGYAINDIGQVAGRAAGRAIIWTSGGGGWTPHELPPLPGDIEALARGINNAGDVVGESGSLPFLTRAALWRRTLGGWDLPIDLVPLDPEGGVTSVSAADINNRGEVVGTIIDDELDIGLRQEAFLWTEEIGFLGFGMFEGRGTVALAISENNQIAGTNTISALLWRFAD